MTKDKNTKITSSTPKGNDTKTNPNFGDMGVRSENPNLPTFRNPPPPPKKDGN